MMKSFIQACGLKKASRKTGTKARAATTKAVAAACRLESLESRVLMSTYYLSPGGSDGAAGTLAAPWRTVQHALDASSSGDVLTLRGGSYAGGVTVEKPNITIQSYAGEQASISSSTGNSSISNTITFGIDASGGKLQGLNISGGYLYAVKTESNWDWGDATRYGASNITIADSKLHDSGRDVVKITPGSDNVKIVRTEIYNAGMRDPSNAEGIDGVNADSFILRDSYIHDIAGNGVYLKGGSINTLIERNKVTNIQGCGIVLGQDSDYEWFDRSANPNLYESINGTVRNNIVMNTEGAGMAAWAAQGGKFYNNTLVNVGKSMMGGFMVSAVDHYLPPDYSTAYPRSSTDVTFINNVVVMGSSRPAVDIREGSLTGSFTTSNNRYYQPGGAAQFWDERNGIYGGLANWMAKFGDAGSSEGNPQVDSAGHLFSSSPCINAAKTIAGITDDYDGQARPAGGAVDIGADESGSATAPAPTPTPAPTPAPTPTPTPDPTTTTPTWVNHAMTSQSGAFTVEFDAKPAQANSDVVVGLSNGAADAYADLAPIVRFNTAGKIDARNGGAYAAQASVGYGANVNYHIKMLVRMAQHQYDVYVTPAGGSQVMLGQNYAFRSEQNAVSSLNNWAKYMEIGNAAISNYAINATPAPAPAPISTGTGLKADYFDNKDFTNLKATRTDATVNFNWGKTAPAAGMGADTFSVRWTGKVQAKYSQTYTFSTTADDGVRLWVNGQLLINNWTDHAATTNSGTITLQAGQKYDIKMEYYENSGGAVAKLLWSSASQPLQVVPQSQLYTA